MKAPDFTLPRLAGGETNLRDYRGKVVVMEFWATWCGPCQFSTPSLEAVYREFHDRGVTVLLINQGEGAQQVRKWARGRFTAPILLDENTEVSAAYGVFGIPHLFIIDKDGLIRYSHSGYSGGLERRLKAILEQMLTPDASKSS